MPHRGRARKAIQLDVLVSRGVSRIAHNPIRSALIALGASIFGGGTIFSLVEKGVSMPDGWWWAWVSLTTVGYGDIAPKTVEIRFLALFVIATGIGATAIFTAALAGRIAQFRLEAANETPELDDDVDAIIAQLHNLKPKLLELQANQKKEEEHEA